MLEEFGYKGLFWHSKKYMVATMLIPKNATTSCRNALGVVQQTAMGHKQATDENYTRVAIIRNPLDKFVSGYLEVIKRKKPRIKEREFWKKSTSDEDKFYRFIEEVEKHGFIDEHIQLQHYAMTDENGKMYELDYILVMETLEKDWNNMCNELGKKMSLVVKNEGNDSKKKEIMDIINSDDSLSNRIDKLLEKDWEIYNKIINDRNGQN